MSATARQTEIASAVREHGSRAAAARALGITGATVSVSLRAYERHTGEHLTRQRPQRLGSHRSFTANLALAADALTPDEIAEGRLWWPRAQDEIDWLARSYGLPFERVAQAAAALSPGLRWEATLDVLTMLLDARAAGEPSYPRGTGHLTFGYRDRAKAWGILAGEIAACRGPKVEAIAANLLGDLDAVAVDRHVVRVATGSDRRQVSPATMRRIAAALALLAVIRGLRPAELQAALWVASRDGLLSRPEGRVIA
jgi:hypothetical protein